MERAEVKKTLKIRFSDRSSPQGGRDGAYGTLEHSAWALSEDAAWAVAVGTNGVSCAQAEPAPKEGSAGSMLAGLWPAQCAERETFIPFSHHQGDVFVPQASSFWLDFSSACFQFPLPKLSLA